MATLKLILEGSPPLNSKIFAFQIMKMGLLPPKIDIQSDDPGAKWDSNNILFYCKMLSGPWFRTWNLAKATNHFTARFAFAIMKMEL